MKPATKSDGLIPLKMGQYIGSTNFSGEYPMTRAYTPQNVLATLYHVLGIDPAATIPDHNGRPQYLLDDREAVKEPGLTALIPRLQRTGDSICPSRRVSGR